MENGSIRMQYVAAFSVSLAYVASNMVGGWPSPMMPRLEAEDSPIPITTDQAGWITSVASLTTVVPVIVMPFLVDRIGRKKLLLYVALPYLAHWLLIGFADSFGMLVAARVVESMGGGVLTTVCPMYLSEIANSKIRGAVGVLHNVMANIGTIIIFSTAPYTSIPTSAIISGSVVVLFAVTFVWMPDSPYFLMLRGREEDAVKALCWLKRTKDRSELEDELAMMRKAVEHKNETKGVLKELFFNRVHRRTFFLLLGLSTIEILCGSATIMSYSTTIFESSGSSIDSNVSSIIVAVVRTFMSVGCALLVDRAGRRPLMIGGFLACGVSIALEGVYFYFVEVIGEVPDAFDWVPLTAFIAFEMFYWLGVGPVLTAVGGEMFHISVKGPATSVKSVVTNLLSFGLKELFVIVTEAVGTFCMFWGFATFCFVGSFYTFMLLPETKGKTFVEINEEMDARASRRRPVDVECTVKEAAVK